MPRNVEKYVTLGASGAVTDVQPRKKDRTITEPLRRLLEQSERLFSQRENLNSFWQECALNYYPEVATFTGERELGEEYADHLTTSYPLLARRALGDAISALLRPVNLDTNSPGIWFSLHLQNPQFEDQDGLRWMDWATEVMRRAMYDRVSQFLKATRMTDHGFVTFGQWPLSVGYSRRGDSLVYRAWHLRDVAWCENGQGEIAYMTRRWKAKAIEVVGVFGADASDKVRDKLADEPFSEVDCRHIVISSEEYGEFRTRKPWISIWIDKTNEHVMRYEASDSRTYIIPRWVGIPCSQYATSPAVTASLPDARLLQAMALTLLDASEKFADPPMAAVQEALRADVNLFPGGITYLDAEYDERLGEALRPVYQPTAGQSLTSAFQMQADLREQLSRAFYLDSLALPQITGSREMTAYEVGARMSEWIRRAMPIFESIEYEYNALLCEETFGLMMRAGAFGPAESMPESLSGQNVNFKFESPLHESADQRKAQKLMSASAILMQTTQIEPKTAPMLNATVALREVLNGTCPPSWVRSDEEMQNILAQQQADAQGQQTLQGMMAGAAAAKDMGSALKDMAAAPGMSEAMATSGEDVGPGGAE